MTIINSATHFGNVLREVRKNRSMSQEELADASDLDRTYISMLERGIKNPTLQTIFNLCHSLDISPDFLIGRVTHLHKNIEKKATTKVADKGPTNGDSITFVRQGSLDQQLEKLMTLKNPTDTFFIRAWGDSMSVTIDEGDYLIVDQSQFPKNGQMILAQVGNELSIKRFHREQKSITLRSDNPLFKTIEVNKASAFSMRGVIVSAFRLNP